MAIPTNTDSCLPLPLAPIRQLGMKIALGLEGIPANRIIMVYGPPSGGKSTLLYQASAEYDHNKDEVWIVDAERAIDRIYLASYFDKEDTLEYKLEALKYYKGKSEKILKEQNKLKDDEKTLPEHSIKLIETRLELIPLLLKELKEEVAEKKLDKRTASSLLRNALAEYRIRNIKILQPGTLEAFEKQTAELLEEKRADPERRHKRLLIGVDSVNYLLTEDVLERTVASEGSNFNTAKYLHTLFPKLTAKLAGTETTMILIYQKAVTIKMNIYQQTSAIEDAATKGGSAGKFGATYMVCVEKRKKVEGADGKQVDTGIVDITKAKLRGGSKIDYKSKFYLREDIEQSYMDFNEPLIMDILIEEQMGVKKKRGHYYVPLDLLEDHPNYEEEIRPKLKTLPKEEDGPSFFTGTEAEIISALLKSPAFEERCLTEFGILTSV